MKHTSVAEIVAFLGREQFFKLHFDLERILCFNKSEQIADAYKVSVGYNGRLAENIAADKVCGFSADSGQRGQILDVIGYLAAEIGDDLFAISTRSFAFVR